MGHSASMGLGKTHGTLHWRHNGRNGVSNHQSLNCLPNRLFRRRSKITSKLRVIGLCVENSPMTGEFPAQMASNAKNVSIWWRHHESWCQLSYNHIRCHYWRQRWQHGTNSGGRYIWPQVPPVMPEFPPAMYYYPQDWKHWTCGMCFSFLNTQRQHDYFCHYASGLSVSHLALAGIWILTNAILTSL